MDLSKYMLELKNRSNNIFYRICYGRCGKSGIYHGKAAKTCFLTLLIPLIVR